MALILKLRAFVIPNLQDVWRMAAIPANASLTMHLPARGAMLQIY
jgi:hypothetical protein